MPTLMIMRAKFPADVDVEANARKFQEDPEILELRDRAGRVPEGIRRHRVYVTADKEAIVVDEWDSAEHFQRWVSQPEVQQLFAKLGVQGQPEVAFAEEIDLGDQIG